MNARRELLLAPPAFPPLGLEHRFSKPSILASSRTQLSIGEGSPDKCTKLRQRVRAPVLLLILTAFAGCRSGVPLHPAQERKPPIDAGTPSPAQRPEGTPPPPSVASGAENPVILIPPAGN